MTTPAAFGAQLAGDDLAELLAALIERDGDTVSGALSSRLDVLAPELTRLWVRFFGGTDRAPRREQDAVEFTERAAQRIRAALLPAAVRPAAVEEILSAAFALGVDSTGSDTPPDALSRPTRAEQDGPDLRRPLDEQTARAISALSVEAVQARGYDTVGEAVAHARRAVARIDSTIAYEATQAASDGVAAVARQTGTHVLWVSERDGCLSCLAYAGETALPGQPFPSGLTFGDHALTPPGALLGPALHPHCRCVLQLHDEADQDVADALKREARRAVLRGWSHDAESERAQLRAAQRLLDTAAGKAMPKSVQTSARRAIRAGEFPDDRPATPSREPRETLSEDSGNPFETPSGTPSANPSELDDEALDRAAQQAIEDGDYDRLDVIAREQDARDDGTWAAAWEPEWQSFEERTGISTSDDATVDDRRLDLMSRLIAEGVDEGEAYAEAYGVSGERFVRDEAIRALRSSGFEGDGFDALARQAYRDHVARAYLEAEDATRGVLLSREAEGRNARAGSAGAPAAIDPEALFSGPLARAQRWASDELLDYWEANGRVTFEEFKAQLLGSGQGNARAAGSGRGFMR